MAAVEERSQGQPLRIETSVGPLFALYADWRYSGRPRKDCSDPVTLWAPGSKRPSRPVWGQGWRPVTRAEHDRLSREAKKRREAAAA